MAWLTLARAKEAIPNFNSADDAVLTNIVEAACNTVDNYCRRKFQQASYVEAYHGTGTQSLFLNQSPVSSVDAIRTGRMPAIYIQNNGVSGVNQSATVQVSTTAVTLKVFASATMTTQSFTFATYPTLSQLRDAINSYGNNWSADVPQVFETWASGDLQYGNIGAFSARNLTVGLQVFYWYLGDWRIHNAGTAVDLAELYYAPGWLRGYNNYLVQYTAGFSTIPEEVLQATAELAKLTYLARRVNPNLQSETIDVYSYTNATQQSFKNLSALAVQTLNQYRITRIARWTT